MYGDGVPFDFLLFLRLCWMHIEVERLRARIHANDMPRWVIRPDGTAERGWWPGDPQRESGR